MFRERSYNFECCKSISEFKVYIVRSKQEYNLFSFNKTKEFIWKLEENYIEIIILNFFESRAVFFKIFLFFKERN